MQRKHKSSDLLIVYVPQGALLGDPYHSRDTPGKIYAEWVGNLEGLERKASNHD